MKFFKLQLPRLPISPGWLIPTIFVITLVLLILHSLSADFIQVDNTSVLLLVVLLITPFAHQIRKIKWGEFEAEISTKEVNDLVKDTQAVSKKTTEMKEIDAVFYRDLYHLASQDKTLALAKLRIEIEARLKRICSLLELTSPPTITDMTAVLLRQKVIDQKLSSLLSDIIDILNRAIHGEPIEASVDVEKILTAGIKILQTLDEKLLNTYLKPKKKKPLSPKLRDEYLNAVYEVETVVPLVDKPYANLRQLTQDQLEKLLEGYYGRAEFLTKIFKIEPPVTKKVK